MPTINRRSKTYIREEKERNVYRSEIYIARKRPHNPEILNELPDILVFLSGELNRNVTSYEAAKCFR